MKRRRLFVNPMMLMIFVYGIGCKSNPVAQQDLRGIWGGEGIHLEFQTCGATVLYACAEGEIEEAVVPDKNGDFSAEGWFSPTAGPEPIGGFPRYPARYEGRIAGSSMTLAVTRLDTDQVVGTFSLKSGDPGEVIFCR